jgi:crotonobetainyl-CoA:carnitine CoA-transferase CaiB-like acyl-CoA transferase
VEPALNLAAQQVIEYTAYDTLLTRTGNRGPAAAPQAVYRCLPERDERDPEWLAIAVANDAQWRALVARVGDSKLEDAAYATDAGRRAGHDAIDEVLAAWCAGRQAVDVEAALLAVDVPASVLMNAQLVTPNAQLEAREFFQTMDHPFSGATRYPTLPMRFSKLDKKHRWPAPSLGQHNEEVLRGDLELTQQEYEKLLADGGAGTRPSFM